MALDERPNFSNAIPALYLGNLVMIKHLHRTLAALTADSTSLGHIAVDIRAVANLATPETLLNAYAIAPSTYRGPEYPVSRPRAGVIRQYHVFASHVSSR